MDVDAAVRLLLAAPLAQPPPASYVALREGAALPHRVVAVDGSHAVLVDNGAVWVVATRAAAVEWPASAREVRPEVHAARVGDAQSVLDAAYAVHGLEPPRAASAVAWAEAWRALREHEALLGAIAAAASDTLVLIDGALLGLPAGPQVMADRARAAAARHAVRLAGVSKRSGLESHGVALVGHLQAHGPPGVWRVQVAEGVYVARLHARSAHAFRVDVARAEDVAALVPLARDAVYVGYPYPLAVAHNRVALTAGAVAELQERLALAARRMGGGDAMRWFADFHAVLDRNVPG